MGSRIEWHGLYGESWQGEIVPEAFSHPAKFSRALIRKIYEFLQGEGLLAAGDHIIDPFGGVALGALEAMRRGMHWHGCELEPRFVELGNQNIGLWNGRYSGWFANWGTAVLHQGDSRRLGEVIGAGDCVVSSPPYVDGGTHQKSGDIDQRELTAEWRNTSGGRMGISQATGYGNTPGQLGSMPSGDFQAAISSPPYADTIERGDGTGARWDAATHPNNPDKLSSVASYGDTAGQLGKMSAAVSSPPFEASLNSTDIDFIRNGNTPNNIGNETGDTFWTAARDIVQETYNALKPGGVAAWVCGDFVRRGERVYFGRQWLELCQSTGFIPYAWAIAWKSEYKGAQLDIFGGVVEKRVDRVSFFRRLANERNPENAILNEDVIFVMKPEAKYG